MNEFLTELGKNLATRWASALALPAAVLVVVAVIAFTLGQAHALDLGLLRTKGAAAATAPAGAMALVAAAFLAATAAVGLTVTALGGLVTATWGATGDGPARPFTALRRLRWRRAQAKVDHGIRTLVADTTNRRARARTRRAVLRRDSIALLEPACPTWAGDRLRTTADSVRRGTGLDLTTTWPRLWLVLPDSARTEVITIQERCASAARTPVWGVAYLAIAMYWWPAVPVGLFVLIASRRRIRRAIGVYADLVEASVDLYARDIAVQLGFEATGRMTPDLGKQVMEALQKRT